MVNSSSGHVSYLSNSKKKQPKTFLWGTAHFMAKIMGHRSPSQLFYGAPLIFLFFQNKLRPSILNTLKMSTPLVCLGPFLIYIGFQ